LRWWSWQKKLKGPLRELHCPPASRKAVSLAALPPGQLASPNAWRHAGRWTKPRVWWNITKPFVFTRQTRDDPAAGVFLDIAYSRLGTLFLWIRRV